MRSLFAAAVLSMLAAPAVAAVRFADWTPDDVPRLLADAAEHDRIVMVLITQPDWCPACIALDRALLRNPEAQDIAALTADWTVLEVLGYDAPWPEFLTSQGLSFQGTPTTLLLKPAPGDERLGEARRLLAVAGFPDDYLDRLRRAAEGHDAIAAAQARVREVNDPAAWQELAAAYLAAGEAEAARRAYRSLLMREELSPDERRGLSLEAIVQPTQRVEKDHARTLAELDEWIAATPDARDDPAYVEARAWSLLALGRVDEARALTRTHMLEPDDADLLAAYLYLVFRHPSDALLADAEARAREGAQQHPEQAARLHAAHGRILRRQGRLDEAEAAFRRAVDQTPPDHPNYTTYVGQLEFVRRARAAPVDAAGAKR